MTLSGLNNLNKSTASNFELYFPLVPTGERIRDSKGLTLNIFQTVIPSITLQSTPVEWQGGVGQYQLGDITYEQWSVSYTIDSNFENWTMLYKWFIFINNNKDKYSESTDKYKVDATLRIIDNFRSEIFNIKLLGMWPNSLGQVGLTYREGDRNLTGQVNFVYDRFELRQT